MFHLKDELVFPTWQFPVLLTVETKILFTPDFYFLFSFLFYEEQIVPDDIVEEDGDQPNDKGAKSVQNLKATKLIIVYSHIDLIIILSW